jgi:LysM repeat protein
VPTFPPELLTPTLTPLSAALITPTPCVPRRDWIPHTVQTGETLFSLARRAQISLAELARANCIADPARLVVGTVIYVPRPLDPPTPIALFGVNIRNCSDPQRRMINVTPDGRLSGVFSIIGTAQHENFQFYKVEIRLDGSDRWQNLITRSTPVEGGVLAELNTALFPSDIYWLRLTVVDQTGNYPPPCEVRVILAP